VFGTLSDIYGRRVMITVSLVLFTAGSILCAVAPNMTVLIVARGCRGSAAAASCRSCRP
jgi:MFS family permease